VSRAYTAALVSARAKRKKKDGVMRSAQRACRPRYRPEGRGAEPHTTTDKDTANRQSDPGCTSVWIYLNVQGYACLVRCVTTTHRGVALAPRTAPWSRPSCPRLRWDPGAPKHHSTPLSHTMEIRDAAPLLDYPQTHRVLIGQAHGTHSSYSLILCFLYSGVSHSLCARIRDCTSSAMVHIHLSLVYSYL
jgi:hypothetical protein